MLSETDASLDELSAYEDDDEEENDTPPALPTASPPRTSGASQFLHSSLKNCEDIISWDNDEHMWISKDTSCSAEEVMEIFNVTHDTATTLAAGISPRVSEIVEAKESPQNHWEYSASPRPSVLIERPYTLSEDIMKVNNFAAKLQAEPLKMKIDNEEKETEEIFLEKKIMNLSGGSKDSNSHLVAAKKTYWDNLIAEKEQSEIKSKDKVQSSEGRKEKIQKVEYKDAETVVQAITPLSSSMRVAVKRELFSHPPVDSESSKTPSRGKQVSGAITSKQKAYHDQKKLKNDNDKEKNEKQAALGSSFAPKSPSPVPLVKESASAIVEDAVLVNDENLKRNIVAEKKGFWDDFIFKREEEFKKVSAIETQRLVVRKDNKRGRSEAEIEIEALANAAVPEEAARETTSLGRTLSITIKRGTVKASQTKYETQVEDEYSKWKRTKVQWQKKPAEETKLPQPLCLPGLKVSTNTANTGIKGCLAQDIQQKPGSLIRSPIKVKATRRTRVPASKPQDELDTSDEEDAGKTRVKRRTSIEIQSGLVQKCRSQWETNTARTGYWTWKRQKVSPAKGKVVSQHICTLSQRKAIGKVPLRSTSPLSPRRSSPSHQHTLSPSSSPSRLTPERASAYGQTVGLPVQKGRDYWEQDQSRTPTPSPPVEIPKRPLTPDEAHHYLSSMRGKVAQQRRRFDSLGSVISSSSAGSLDSLDNILEPRGSDNIPVSLHTSEQQLPVVPGRRSTASSSGMVGRQRTLWENKTKVMPPMGSKTSPINAKRRVLERRHSAEVLPVVGVEGKAEGEDEGEEDVRALQEEQERRTILYVLHNTVEGELLLETFTDFDQDSRRTLTESGHDVTQGHELPKDGLLRPPQPANRRKKRMEASTGRPVDRQGIDRTDKGLCPTVPNLPLLLAPTAPVQPDVVDDGYLKYKHNFASARQLFETGMREIGSDFRPHKETGSVKVTNADSLATIASSGDLTATQGSPASLTPPPSPSDTGSLSLQTSQNIPDSLTPSTTPTTPIHQQHLGPPLEVGFVWEAETQTEPYTEEAVFPRTVLVNTGCQTDDEGDEGFHSNLQQQPHPRMTRTPSPVKDQEIQVIEEDLVNPLKRLLSQKTRKYDLLEMPLLKRRIYQRRSGFTHQRRRTLSASDMPCHQHWDAPGVSEPWSGPEVATVSGMTEIMPPWCKPEWATAWSGSIGPWDKPEDAAEWSGPKVAMALNRLKIMSPHWNPEGTATWYGPKVACDRSEMAWDTPEMVQDTPEMVWGTPEVTWGKPEVPLPQYLDASPPNSGTFGLTDSSSLVASLRDLGQDLPSAYPDALPQDDLADLDPDNFSFFPENEIRRLALRHAPGSMVAALNSSPVIQTLSGCYTGEFPHLPVPGTGRTYSLQGGRKDLISLKDLRRQACPHVTLAPPHNSDDEDSPVRIVPSPPLPADPPTHQSKGLLYSPTRSLLRTSSESLVSSAEGEAEVCWRTGGDASGHLTRPEMEVEAGSKVTGDLNSQTERRQREKTEEVNSSDGKEEEVTDSEEIITKQDVEMWSGCRAYGEGLQWGTVHEANAFIIDTSEAESGEIRVSVEVRGRALCLPRKYTRLRDKLMGCIRCSSGLLARPPTTSPSPGRGNTSLAAPSHVRCRREGCTHYTQSSYMQFHNV
ncbi:uncharacterized protein LOC123510019 [Portunus trituberculatus]|uniref:uncharacterized protein LOC123510019 n=1 Tax=Portunus trituberculatus TaxID=210409 RepID=UPI001E1CD359|nr:uncharacterized protein LOC123510019 [Portunus trituberculatus]